MEAADIEQMLLNEVRAARGHEAFSANSALDLMQVIRLGAQRVVAEGRTTEADVRTAQENMRHFLDAMEASRVKHGYTEFHEDNVAEAQSECQWWPLCG